MGVCQRVIEGKKKEMYSFKPKGICAKEILFEMDGDKVKDVKFVGGCEGNHVGIEMLVKGMEMDDVIKKLDGITCGPRKSSCPDQLACALRKYKEQM